MSFLIWSLLIGLPTLALGLAAAILPSRTGDGLVRFCDAKYPAWVLTAIGWAWTAWECHIIGIAMFDKFLKAFPFELPILALILIPLTCVWMPKLLALRGVSAILMLFPCEFFKCTRLVDSDWRLVAVSWSYVLLTLGMFMMFYPWHVETAIKWLNARRAVLAVTGGAIAAVGAVVVLAGFLA